MKRLVSLAAAGLLCGATMMGASGVASASGIAVRSVPLSARYSHINPGGVMYRAPGNSTSYPTISLNWSGYATLSAKKFNYVHATFVQPAITCVGKPYMITSNWVGFDGFNNETVEQDGTFAFCGGKADTTPEYWAWYEMFPAGSVLVFRVTPGDIIDVSVSYASGTYTLTVSDLTSGKTHTQTATCSSCLRDSAEWIIERAAFCVNRSCTKAVLGALAPFRSTTMAGDTASIDGGKVMNLAAFHNIPIFMVDPLQRGFITDDTVGPVSGASFTATWDRSGTPTPITLGPRR
jgi:hypothetical protein